MEQSEAGGREKKNPPIDTEWARYGGGKRRTDSREDGLHEWVGIFDQ